MSGNKIIKHLITLAILLFVTKGVFSQVQIGFQINSKEDRVEVPMTLVNNLIIVQVKFNHLLPLKFIVDTGVRNTVLLDRTYSDLLDIEPDRKLSIVGASGGPAVSASIANNISIDLYGIIGRGLSILILDEDYLDLSQMLGQSVHGILGFDLFRNFVVEIDYENEKLIFHKPGTYKKRPFAKVFEMKVEDTKPYIEARIDTKHHKNVKLKLMIDTGASHSLMLHTDTSEKIILPDKRIRDLIGVGLGGDIHGEIGRIPKIKLAAKKYELHQIVTSYPDKGTYMDMIANTGRNGTIGGMFLNRFHVVFDYTNETLYLRKLWLKRPFYYDMSGITAVAEGSFYEKVIIKKLREGSPAARAGLQLGDEIIRANQYTGSNLTLNNLSFLLRKRSNKKITLVVMRGDEKMKFQFRLQDPI